MLTMEVFANFIGIITQLNWKLGGYRTCPPLEDELTLSTMQRE
jgi:hypothetical protein